MLAVGAVPVSGERDEGIRYSRNPSALLPASCFGWWLPTRGQQTLCAQSPELPGWTAAKNWADIGHATGA